MTDYTACLMTDYKTARRRLMRADPKLGVIIKKVGPCRLHVVGPRDPFETLTRSIASQQLSTKAANTIFGRFCDLFPKGKPLPDVVMTLTDDQIRGVGFSRPKSRSSRTSPSASSMAGWI